MIFYENNPGDNCYEKILFPLYFYLYGDDSHGEFVVTGTNEPEPMILENVTAGVNEEQMTQFLGGDAREVTIPVNTTFTIGMDDEAVLERIESRFSWNEKPSEIKW